ncbi:type VII toxin-antitoxin system MntA family adenylyltransferase antitoxin [Halorhodospira halophila]|uniref:DNA polymerase, beta domain protein region n=1 Tax=Halorhodospira halophila (strain DSM 244 / SL1) TaxID=349124 RepID=A1WV89_HALHL|nr:nucleotidyltransferase domain-containing protein [Halorhodospira halophila]ABM61601.1 DNA polymerase, beta domain protein region [Halorhodospira halophila SL1]MBK1729941.1 nucleotidyltransferase domain-containing protein [Halorhodospira halophila]
MTRDRVEAIQQTVEPVLKAFPDVQAAFLFGSHVTGRARADSDVDLGLVGPPERLAAQRLDLLAELTRAGLERIDLVLLDSADPALQFEAIRHNCLIYARPDFQRGTYFSRVVREYWDWEPYLQVQRAALKRRLQRGASIT